MRNTPLSGDGQVFSAIHDLAVVSFHYQQGCFLAAVMGEVEAVIAAALCQHIVDAESAGLAIGDEFDGLSTMFLQIAQDLHTARQGRSVICTGIGAHAAALVHGKRQTDAFGVGHPQLKNTLRVRRHGLSGAAASAGMGTVFVINPSVVFIGSALIALVRARRRCPSSCGCRSLRRHRTRGGRQHLSTYDREQAPADGSAG